MKEEWRSAIITNGELSAITTGISLMLMLCASNLDSLVVSVNQKFYFSLLYSVSQLSKLTKLLRREV